MKLVIGVDEAGYGPAMGPLVIGASVWKVPDHQDVASTLAELSPEFCASTWSRDSTFIPLGDSKKIYQPSATTEGLLVALLFWFEQISQSQKSVASLLLEMAPIDLDRMHAIPWYQLELIGGAATLPALNGHINDTIIDRAIQKAKLLEIEFVSQQLRVLDEPKFNHLVGVCGNKATVLSEISLELVHSCIEKHGEDVSSIEVYCDRHGGRKRYSPLLSYVFGEWKTWIETVEESNHCSRYGCRWNDREVSIQFKVDGDSIYPSALSSIAAKWAREMLMLRLNQFWGNAVGRAIPRTAGYYVDAVRFADEIQSTATKLGYDKSQWWRIK